MLNRWGQGGGYNAALSLYLPLDDAGSGAVNLVPGSAAGSPTATFTRATTATTILSSGLIGSVASGTARSCYSPAGVYLGYLAEEQRTNLCLQSADLSNASWTKGDLTIGGSVTLPDGTTGTVNKLQEDNVNSSHSAQQSITKAASALAYTASIYFKQAERTWAQISLDDGSTNGIRAWFNLATGAVGSTAGIGTPFTSVSISIVQAANGFYRCILTATSNTATTLRLIAYPATGDTITTYTGTTGSGIYAWGAQLEQASFATSYIPTTTASVTRNADVLTYPLANISATAGSAYAEASVPAVPATNIYVLSSAGADRPALYRRGATNDGAIFDGTTEVHAGAWSAGASIKIATRWASDLAVSVNGAAPTTGAFDGNMDFATSISIGNQGAGASAFLNGTIKNVRIWTRALSDTELVNLTTT